METSTERLYRSTNKNKTFKISSALDKAWIGGILFTFVIAAIGIALSKLPIINQIGSMVTAIIIAIIYRQFAGYPEAIRSGVQFTGKKILRFAIILFGLKLNIYVIFHQGLELLIGGAIIIMLAVFATMMTARWLKADKTLSLLLAVGTGVCGAAAIAAVSPIIKSKDEDTALGVGIIALMGTVFTIIYTLVRPFIPFSDTEYGIWSGISLHEVAHVAAAAAPAGENALGIALVAKLGRVLLLIPFCFSFLDEKTECIRNSNKGRISLVFTRIYFDKSYWYVCPHF
jgi:uncharacterized integral membrane protein (TIGR00698 family)